MGVEESMNIRYVKRKDIPNAPHDDSTYFMMLVREFLLSGNEAAEITFDEYRKAKCFVSYVKSRKLNATQRKNVVYLWRDGV